MKFDYKNGSYSGWFYYYTDQESSLGLSICEYQAHMGRLVRNIRVYVTPGPVLDYVQVQFNIYPVPVLLGGREEVSASLETAIRTTIDDLYE